MQCGVHPYCCTPNWLCKRKKGRQHGGKFMGSGLQPILFFCSYQNDKGYRATWNSSLQDGKIASAPNCGKQDWVPAKADLKDTYLTVPVAQQFYQLLAKAQQVDSVQVPTIWTLHSTFHLLKGPETSIVVSVSAGDSSDSVSWWPADSSSQWDRITTGLIHSTVAPGTLGFVILWWTFPRPFKRWSTWAL